MILRRRNILLLVLLFCAAMSAASEYPAKKILILVEGNGDIKSDVMGAGRQLGMLLGHFNAQREIKGVAKYSPGECNAYDYIFYIGFSRQNPVPAAFVNDMMASKKTFIWMHTGMMEASADINFRRMYGFSVNGIDTLAMYNKVKATGKTFTKGEPNINIVQISDKSLCKVLAVAASTSKRKETPYIVKTKNLLYIADCPFSSATETDRYLLFSDMLHDILGEEHETSHSAILRIEDITPLDNPEKLREIADYLSAKGIPFLVGVVPFYVDPGKGLRIPLSEKPEMVDALKYMVLNGGTIVMHGVTHQYKGVTAADFEFWDESTNSPIRDETEAGIAKKIESGIQELMKCGLYPLLWETPHYTASFLLYKTIPKFFSTAIEQRLSIENFDFSQYFPYIIEKDLWGQKIYPENLGYVPYDANIEVSRTAVRNIIRGAKANLAVRDGFAACFFHEFLDMDLLKELVEGITGLGYEYINLREAKHWVKTKDRVILTGSQDFTITLSDQYLVESYFEENGEIRDRVVSPRRISGEVTKSVNLGKGEIFKAEPTEFKIRETTFWEKVTKKASSLYGDVFHSEKGWSEARPVILWNHYARGAAYNDQASLAAVFRSVNVHVDTVFVGQKINLQKYNLLIAPYAFVDSLQESDFDRIADFVLGGGNIITDMRSELSKELGIKFTQSKVKVFRVRDLYFPDEPISWRYPEQISKVEAESSDEIFCVDDVTDLPIAFGREHGKGKILFFNTLFDPYSQHGYSLYPFLLEYVRKYCSLRPVVQRNNLEMFFDPGFRHTYSIENLVKQWVQQGVRVIHAAGWHKYPKYTYDYERLIRLAHANGILVYAWLEPPQVSQKFWNDHPEWREKNHKGEDVRPSWRYPVALTEPACVRAMLREYGELLTKFDWDGANIAELYFEAAKGFENPDLFTPMHPSARKEFLRKYNVDLKDVFNPGSGNYWKTNPEVRQLVVKYRIEKLNEVYEMLFGRFQYLKTKKPGFQFMVTAMDSYGSPELREYIGVDMENILRLQKKYGFVLNVEDPENKWSTSPERYKEIGAKYEAMMGGNSFLALDINILSFRKKDKITPFPTLIQTGTECFQVVASAAEGSPRMVIYAESSVNPQDMMFLPYALAGKASVKPVANGYAISSPYSVHLKLPLPVREILVDGKLLAPARDNQYLVPAGNHMITFSSEGVTTFSAHELQTKILSLSANLLSIAYGMRSVSLEYDGNTRTLLSLDREPTRVKVDGKDYAFSAMKGNDCFTIFLPAGKHQVVLEAGDQFAFGINLTSLWSSTAIAIFGALGVLALLIMYGWLKAVKKRSQTTSIKEERKHL